MEPKFIRTSEIGWEQKTPRVKRVVIHGEKCSMQVNSIQANDKEPGQKQPFHKHAHEQMIYIVSGSTGIEVGDKSYSVKAGDVIVIPSNVEHRGLPGTCTMIDFFVPVREDYPETPNKPAKK
jgi:quercetin dioxygenase-like cupin family protein